MKKSLKNFVIIEMILDGCNLLSLNLLMPGRQELWTIYSRKQ